MTKQNIYCEPQLFIGGRENLDFGNINLIFKGGSSLITMSVSISNPDYNNFNLFNKPISFYLNQGTNDSIPIFRGFIKDVNAQSDQVSIKALDARCFLTGKEGIPISITDKNNYDGFTVVQFLQSYIMDYINKDETIIGLSALKDIDNPPLMNGVRVINTTDVYGIVKKQILAFNNDADLNNIKKCYIDMIDDGLYNNITIYADKDIEGAYPSLILTFNDGLLDYTYKKRSPSSSIIVTGQTGAIGTFTYGNTPLGKLGKTLRGEYESNAEAQQAGIIDILQNYDSIDTLKVNCSKGYYINLGDIVQLQVPELEISRNFRLSGKKITMSGSKVSLSLDLAKPKVKVGMYIQETT